MALRRPGIVIAIVGLSGVTGLIAVSRLVSRGARPVDATNSGDQLVSRDLTSGWSGRDARHRSLAQGARKRLS